MATKRYGPVEGPGVVIVEKEAEKTITKGTLGVTAYAGILERGPVLDDNGNLALITCPDKKTFTKKCGGRIDDSECPDAAFDFYEASEGAGTLLLARVTDGNEIKAERTFRARQFAYPFYAATPNMAEEANIYLNSFSPAASIVAKNGGEWAGKRRFLSGSFSIGNLVDNTLKTGGTIAMLEDEWKGATISFDDCPSVTFTITGNTASTTSGTLATDGVLTMETANSTVEIIYKSKIVMNLAPLYRYSIEKNNEVEEGLQSKGIDVVFKDGIEDAVNNFGLDVYLDGTLVKTYSDLSLDPASAYYAESVINDDTSNYWVEFTDEYAGTGLDSRSRPANFHQPLLFANANYAMVNIYAGSEFDFTDANFSGRVEWAYTARTQSRAAWLVTDANIRTVTTDTLVPTVAGLTIGSDMKPMRIKLTCTSAAVPGAEVWSVEVFDYYTGDQIMFGLPNATTEVRYAWPNAWGQDFAIKTPDPAGGIYKLNDTMTFYWEPMIASKYKNGWFYPDAIGSRRTKMRIVDNTYDTLQFKTNVVVGDVATVGDAGFNITPGVGNSTADVEVLLSGVGLTAGQTYNVTIVSIAGGATLDLATFQIFNSDGNPIPLNGTSNYGPFVAWNINNPALVDTVYFHLDTVNDNFFLFSFIDSGAPYYGPLTAVQVGDTWEISCDNAVAEFRIEAGDGLHEGYDGIATVDENDYALRFDVDDSAFNQTTDKGYGLVKFAIPGVDIDGAQQSARDYAETKNHQYRAEIPSDIVDEDLAEIWVNDDFGRSDMAVTSFPSHAYVADPDNASVLKLQTLTGKIHGVEAKYARTYLGYHKAAADISATLPGIKKLPTGEKMLNQELLNKQGIGMIVKKNGRYVLWGDRTLWVDSAWKWKHQREQMSYYEHDLQEKFDWIIFAINDVETQSLAIAAATSYFYPEWTKRAIRGSKFSDACAIKCDAENNTDATRAEGDMYMEITLQLADTVERFIITMNKAGIFDSIS